MTDLEVRLRDDVVVHFLAEGSLMAVSCLERASNGDHAPRRRRLYAVGVRVRFDRNLNAINGVHAS